MPRVFDRAEIDRPEHADRPDATGGAAVPAMAAAVSSLLVSLLVVSASAGALTSGAANLDNVFGVLAAGSTAPGGDAASDGQVIAAGDAPADPAAGDAPALDEGVPDDGVTDDGVTDDDGFPDDVDEGDPADPEGDPATDEDGGADPVDPGPGRPAAPGDPPAPAPGAPAVPAVPAVTPAPAPAVRLYDDDEGAALFSLPAMAPGRSYQRCITVTYEGATPARVALVTEADGALAEQLDVRIEVGRSGSYADCTDFVPEGTVFTGTLAGLADLHGPDGAGLDALRITSTPTSRSFRMTLALVGDPGDATANADFQWRATPD